MEQDTQDVELWIVELMKHLKEPLTLLEVLQWADYVKGPPAVQEGAQAALWSLHEKGILESITLTPCVPEVEELVVFYPGPKFFYKEVERKVETNILEKWKRNIPTDPFARTPNDTSPRRGEQLPSEVVDPRHKKMLHQLNLLKMERLHDLNKVKDDVASLLGIMAEQQNCTVKDLYKQFNLPLNS